MQNQNNAQSSLNGQNILTPVSRPQTPVAEAKTSNMVFIILVCSMVSLVMSVLVFVVASFLFNTGTEDKILILEQRVMVIEDNVDSIVQKTEKIKNLK